MTNKAIKGEGPFIGTRRYWGIWVSYKTPLSCERNLWNVRRYLYDGLCTLRDRTAMHLFSPTFVRHPYWVNLIFAFNYFTTWRSCDRIPQRVSGKLFLPTRRRWVECDLRNHLRRGLIGIYQRVARPCSQASTRTHTIGVALMRTHHAS